MDENLIIIEPSGSKVGVDHVSSVLELIRKAGLFLPSECGGTGVCGKCQVRIQPSIRITDTEKYHINDEDLARGVRLACEHIAEAGWRITLAQTQSKVQILVRGGVKPTGFEIDESAPGSLGVAIDLGTTTVVCFLHDLTTGAQLNEVAVLNPQIAYGEDVVSRLEYAARGLEERATLTTLVREQIGNCILGLCSDRDFPISNVAQLAIVGNTAMQHLFLGLEIDSLIRAPFKPTLSESFTTSGIALSEDIRNSQVYVAPNIDGFVGGDTVGFILAHRLDAYEGTALGIDIGTNGEIVLSQKGQIYSCSTAAGSAFEGATIKQGMRAQEGAIDYVFIDDPDRAPRVSVIGDSIPRGLCGSAIVDVVAELRNIDIVTTTGKLGDSARITTLEDGLKTYRLLKEGECKAEHDITFTQKDIRQVQLAKAAIQAGTRILMKRTDVALRDLDAVFLAGAFGNYIRPASAHAIGLLPAVDSDKVIPVGNAAGDGAKRMVLSKKQRELAESIARKCNYINLATDSDFERVFIESTSLEPGF